MTNKEPTATDLPLEELMGRLPYISEQLVMRVAFGASKDTPPAEVEALKRAEEVLFSPQYIRPFQAEVKTLIATLQSQIETYKLSVGTGRRANPLWHKKVGSLHSRLVALLVKINARVKEMNREASASRASKNLSLLQAIEHHKATVLREGYEPTEADMELWKSLD